MWFNGARVEIILDTAKTNNWICSMFEINGKKSFPIRHEYGMKLVINMHRKINLWFVEKSKESGLRGIYYAYAEFLVWLMMALIQNTSKNMYHTRNISKMSKEYHIYFRFGVFVVKNFVAHLSCVCVIKYMSWKTCMYIFVIREKRRRKWNKQWKKKKNAIKKKTHWRWKETR